MRPRVRLFVCKRGGDGRTKVCEIRQQIFHNNAESIVNVYFYMLRGTYVFTTKSKMNKIDILQKN